MTTSMSTRQPQPPAKQFILRQRATDAELLELYLDRDKCYRHIEALEERVKDFLSNSRKEAETLEREERELDFRIADAKEQVRIPVIAVMDPSKNTKTLYYPEDTSFKNPIETVPMRPEDYELPLL